MSRDRTPLIVKILKKHIKDQSVIDNVHNEIKGLLHQTEEHSKMMSIAITSMTTEIDMYKNKLELNQEKMLHQGKMSTIGEVTTTLSHEFNNQMMILSGNCELASMINRNFIKNEKLEALLKTSDSTLKNMSKLIKDIRKFSHHSKNEILEVIEDNPVNIIEESVNICANMNKNVKIKVNFDYTNSKHASSFIPSSELGQVFLNLIKNAHDYISTSNLPEDKRWINIKSEYLSDRVKISFSNYGTIPDNVVLKLFQPFFTTKEVGKGTGIGLSLSKKILEMIHGKISFENKDNEIFFHLEFPIFKTKEEFIAQCESCQKNAS